MSHEDEEEEETHEEVVKLYDVSYELGDKA